MREKKVDNFQLSWRILEIVKRKETFIKNGSQQRGNRFSSTLSGVYKDFIKNLIRQQQENINQQQKQNINRIHIRGCFLKYIGIDLY